MKNHITPKSKSAFEEIGSHIRTWRILYELKSEQVAQRAGISLGTLRKIENGDLSVGTAAFFETLRSLGLLNYVVEGIDPLNTDLGRARIKDNMPQRIRK